MDLATLEKSDFTEDFGLDAAGPIAFDVNDDLYTHSFRPMKLFRMDEDRSFSQVGAGTGYAQSIACDGVYFYLASADGVGSNGNQILRIDPVSGATDVMATRLGGWRTVTFDAYGRLILCSIVNSSASLYRAGTSSILRPEWPLRTSDRTPKREGNGVRFPTEYLHQHDKRRQGSRRSPSTRAPIRPGTSAASRDRIL